MISIILGTRPEIIKMSPLVREFQRKGMDHFIIKGLIFNANRCEIYEL